MPSEPCRLACLVIFGGWHIQRFSRWSCVQELSSFANCQFGRLAELVPSSVEGIRALQSTGSIHGDIEDAQAEIGLSLMFLMLLVKREPLSVHSSHFVQNIRRRFCNTHDLL